jgi:RNA polymerase sigma factor (sigma-70 family)
MCPDECKAIFKTNIEAIVAVFKANLQQDADKIISCFYNCLKQEFIKRSSIIYNGYPEEFMAFVSNTAFTDSILLFTTKAAAGNIYDGNVNIRSVLSGFYMTTLRQNLQSEKRLLEKKEKYTLGYREEVAELNTDSDEAIEKRYLILQLALTKMEPADRQIIIWRHLDEKTCDEIAALLGITRASATNRIYRCMERLRNLTENTN